ncbi:predicted protein [Naegleria gruberi]|uniref:Cilia- and flagella-associated protein 36 n=1 Tax=Naegleria gruberi TaxID=5762 RepID=D2V2L0_NAEGR|nr:uncharacterized protein NAEGRDRAFT_63036 [Naegleria gruberi]EFC48914.1 predicted protein [Naegleria gruberi]|eukprot:XP_002681658.1 predicted protein [Naegleria gruberi strain NEG-M]
MDDKVEEFGNKHCDIFEIDEEEQKLEYTNVYNKFVKLFESKVEELLKQKGVTPQEFYIECKRLSEEENDQEIVEFLLALSDYQVFYNMMKEIKLRKLGKQQ